MAYASRQTKRKKQSKNLLKKGNPKTPANRLARRCQTLWRKKFPLEGYADKPPHFVRQSTAFLFELDLQKKEHPISLKKLIILWTWAMKQLVSRAPSSLKILKGENRLNPLSLPFSVAPSKYLNQATIKGSSA